MARQAAALKSQNRFAVPVWVTVGILLYLGLLFVGARDVYARTLPEPVGAAVSAEF